MAKLHDRSALNSGKRRNLIKCRRLRGCGARRCFVSTPRIFHMGRVQRLFRKLPLAMSVFDRFPDAVQTPRAVSPARDSCNANSSIATTSDRSPDSAADTPVALIFGVPHTVLPLGSLDGAQDCRGGRRGERDRVILRSVDGPRQGFCSLWILYIGFSRFGCSSSAAASPPSSLTVGCSSAMSCGQGTETM
jgi:hypothetical protein